MEVKVLGEYGFSDAMLGLSLSYDRDVDGMHDVSLRLYNKDGGHNKFLRAITVNLDITASRAWWQQMATYCVGNTFQSGSTMHTLTKRQLRQDDFYGGIHQETLVYLNALISRGDLIAAKRNLPESFLQRRVMTTNYLALRNIIKQRMHHKLPEWRFFVEQLFTNLKYPEYVSDLREEYEVTHGAIRRQRHLLRH